MSLVRNLGVFFLSLILIFSLFLFSFSLILSSFLYPTIYSETFEKAGVYEFIENNLDKSGSATFIATPNGTKPLVKEILTNFLDYLRSDTDKLDMSVKIDTAKLNSFFTESAMGLKKCTQAQNPFGDNPCLPDGKNASEFVEEFLQSRNLSFFEKDRVDLAEVYGINEGSQGRESIDNIREYINYYKISQIILTIFIIVVLFLIYLIQRPNIRKFFRTISINFAVLFVILISIIFAIKLISESLSISNQTIIPILTAILSILNYKLLIYSKVIITIAIILLAVSLTIGNKAKKQINLNTKNKVK